MRKYLLTIPVALLCALLITFMPIRLTKQSTYIICEGDEPHPEFPDIIYIDSFSSSS